MKLIDKTITELVELHNGMNPEKPIKKFRDKTTAINRVRALSDARSGGLTDFCQNAEQEGDVAVGDTHNVRRAGVRAFNFPARAEWKFAREGCKRERLEQHMLQRENGATFNELFAWATEQAFGWKPVDLADAIRLAHVKDGFGVQTDTRTGLISFNTKTSA
ncbi:MAG: hypothetical protein NXH85_11895 [Pseudomonadaceae bacterium]|nr:hypothetical protein [Pseudomonadaceae bacterium]